MAAQAVLFDTLAIAKLRSEMQSLAEVDAFLCARAEAWRFRGATRSSCARATGLRTRSSVS